VPELTLTFFELLSLLIAVIAAVISVVSLARTRQVAQRQIELQRANLELQKEQALLAKFQRELLEREEQAKVRANVVVYAGESVTGLRFFVRNTGPVPAHDVNVEVISRQTMESVLIKEDVKAKLPIKCLNPEIDIGLIPAITLQSGNSFEALVSWRDPDDSVQRMQFDLST